MTAVEVLHRDQDFRLLRTQEDAVDNAYWCFMHAHRFPRDTGYRACFSVPLMKEMREFLKRLKRNNRREWFLAHRDEYEKHVREPMIAVLEQLAIDMRKIAPELLVGPKSMYRIYRDVRFSENKLPYKTHVAASFRPRDVPKGEGADRRKRLVHRGFLEMVTARGRRRVVVAARRRRVVAELAARRELSIQRRSLQLSHSRG